MVLLLLLNSFLVFLCPLTADMFVPGIDGTESAEMVREHACLEDAVPLLTSLDFPRRRRATMAFGAAITTHSVQNFVDSCLSGNASFEPLKPYTEKC